MAFFKQRRPFSHALPENLPLHIGIIMDGNGRWAKKRSLPRTAGHTAGANNFRTIARYCSDIGIRYLTVYAFSTENWKRPADEVSSLMSLFKSYLVEALTDFKDDSIVVKFLGDKSAFNPELQKLIAETELESAQRSGMILNIAMNYGGREEILHAAKTLARQYKDGTVSLENFTEKDFARLLYTSGQPDPDLVIRPSGEYRISNFLLWQSAYTEYVIMNKLWPDFTKDDLNWALSEYARRNRRFGGV